MPQNFSTTPTTVTLSSSPHPEEPRSHGDSWGHPLPAFVRMPPVDTRCVQPGQGSYLAPHSDTNNDGLEATHVYVVRVQYCSVRTYIVRAFLTAVCSIPGIRASLIYPHQVPGYLPSTHLVYGSRSTVVAELSLHKVSSLVVVAHVVLGAGIART